MSNRVTGGRVGTAEAEAQDPPDQPRSPFPALCVPSHARLCRGFFAYRSQRSNPPKDLGGSSNRSLLL